MTAGLTGAGSHIPGDLELGSELDIAIVGERHSATVIPESPFDLDNQRLIPNLTMMDSLHCHCRAWPGNP